VDVLLLLQESPPLFYATVGILGLMVGSFLNVVIHRLPIILDRQWSQQCREHLDIAPVAATDEPPFNLVRPASCCPVCGHRIRALENIPVLSYLVLKGRCSDCGTRISPRYPITELVTAILSIITVMHFGFTIQGAMALLFLWTVIPLTIIDYDRQLLPDTLTLPLLWIGLALSMWDIFVGSHSSITGAIAGYLSLWLVFQLFRLATGKEGMGFGDFKLLAAIGAWTGWQLLPIVILFSSAVGAVTGILLILLKGHDRSQPLPFGPFLAAAGWITLLWGQDILTLYLH
jgi:leader peptidase (prepilin peptidase)/N-methyltransferase